MFDDQATPAQALEAARLSRHTLGDRLNPPGWYGPLYALMLGGMVAAQALEPVWSLFTSVACFTVIVAAHRIKVRTMGVSVLGVTPRRARWVAVGLALVFLTIFAVAVGLKLRADLWWAPLAGAPVAAAAALFGSRLWLRVYRRELAAEA